jgi:hypothetical protein
MMKNTVLQIVLDNTDGVTVAKLARTAKIKITPVHYHRVERDEDYGIAESKKHEFMRIKADFERYLYGDVPVEFRENIGWSLYDHYIKGEGWVDGTRVIEYTRPPWELVRDNGWLQRAYWERVVNFHTHYLYKWLCNSEEEFDYHYGPPGDEDWDIPEWPPDPVNRVEQFWDTRGPCGNAGRYLSMFR